MLQRKKILPRLISGVTFHYISVITPIEIFIQGEVDVTQMQLSINFIISRGWGGGPDSRVV